MIKLTKPHCALAVAALLLGSAIPASADNFSIFGGGHRDREDRVQERRVEVIDRGTPIVVEPAATIVTPGTVTTTTYSTYDPYYDQNYVYDDREGYRYYRDGEGHVLGRVLMNAIGRQHSR